jgi:hypothetical protein
MDVRPGASAMFYYAIVSFISSCILPILTSYRIMKRSQVWAYSSLFMGVIMISTLAVKDVKTATVITALAGIPWAVSLWVSSY